jgi:repressor LexA
MTRSAQSADVTAADLTDRQRKIIQAIEDSVRRCGYSPTLREIGEAAGLASASSVSHQLAVLQKKGYLSRGAGRPRTAVVRPSAAPAPRRRGGRAPAETGARRVAQVPLVGRIAAGGPILAVEAVVEVFRLPRHLVGEGEHLLV